MPLSDAEREVETTAALADALFDSAQVRLYPIASLWANDHVGAAWFRPGDPISDDDPHFRDDALRVRANQPDAIDLHRIVVTAHPDNGVTFAALLRHELEHARQFDAVGAGVSGLLSDVPIDVKGRGVGGVDR
jgi:hypothetical protein